MDLDLQGFRISFELLSFQFGYKIGFVFSDIYFALHICIGILFFVHFDHCRMRVRFINPSPGVIFLSHDLQYSLIHFARGRTGVLEHEKQH